MIFAIGFLVFCLVFTGLYGLLYSFNKDKIVLKTRMEEIRDLQKIRINDGKESSFSTRAMQPFSEKIGKMLRRLSPAHRVTKVNKKLKSAGLGGKLSFEKWAYYNIIFSLVLTSIFAGFFFFLQPNIINALLFGSLGIMITQVGMRFYLGSKITNKRKRIVKDLPFTLDLITVSVEAGLSFDGALSRVLNNIQGALSDEFAKTLKEMKMGIQRKVALRNMSERNDIKELSMLITSLIQADSLGVSLGNVLRIESDQLRETRKQVAREKAMKAPVKMLFPLILFIFPAIFVVILGPAAIKIASMFIG